MVSEDWNQCLLSNSTKYASASDKTYVEDADSASSTEACGEVTVLGRSFFMHQMHGQNCVSLPE